MTATLPERPRLSLLGEAVARAALHPGAALLDEVAAFLARFVAYPSPHAHVAHTLWIAHTHLMDAWESTARIAFLSPEPGSGKTRALEVSELLVPRPVEAVNVTPAYLFRKVGSGGQRPTILYDEIDTVFGPKAKDNEEIRGLLNAGHRRGAVAGRCVVRGKLVETEEIPAYCAVALAGLGDLPDTLLSRSVVIRMRRRAPGEKVEPYRRREHAPDGEVIRDRLSDWAADVVGKVTGAWPAMPSGITDRPADVWEPLLAVADAAGGSWPDRARTACVELVTAARTADSGSLGIRLLADLREVFAGRAAMSTEEILTALCALDESPWADIRGKPLNALGLARRLKGYRVAPHPFRHPGGEKMRGYSVAGTDKAGGLGDPWDRYLPPLPHKPGTPGTAGTPLDPASSDPAGSVPGDATCTGTDPEPGTEDEALTCDVPFVPGVPGLWEDENTEPDDPAPAGEAEPTEPPEPACSDGLDPIPDNGQVPEPLWQAEPEDPSLSCDVPEVPQVPLPGDGKQGPCCTSCEQPLLLHTPGRTQCERCRLREQVAEGAPGEDTRRPRRPIQPPRIDPGDRPPAEEIERQRRATRRCSPRFIQSR